MGQKTEKVTQQKQHRHLWAIVLVKMWIMNCKSYRYIL